MLRWPLLPSSPSPSLVLPRPPAVPANNRISPYNELFAKAPKLNAKWSHVTIWDCSMDFEETFLFTWDTIKVSFLRICLIQPLFCKTLKSNLIFAEIAPLALNLCMSTYGFY
jgi:hypothetical protein